MIMPSWSGAGLHYVCHIWYSSSVLSVSVCIEAISKDTSSPATFRQRTLRLDASICTPQARDTYWE
jgi:hypothetical protein